MYTDYWGLRGSPFQNALDDGWFFESPLHQEAVARLLYLTDERRVCGLLAGPEGTGKSLVFHRLSRMLRRGRRLVAEADLGGVDGHEMLWRICATLGLGPRRGDGPARLWRILDDFLAGAHLARSQAVILFDHADRAFPECGPVLERLLNLARRSTGGLTILVATRTSRAPVCEAVLPQTDLRIDLPPLDAPQTARYVAESLRHAGCERELFPPRAIAAVYQTSRGVPRVVNRLCELSLLAAMHDDRQQIDPEIVLGVAAELSP